jgi:signal transduction histidine kinase
VKAAWLTRLRPDAIARRRWPWRRRLSGNGASAHVPGLPSSAMLIVATGLLVAIAALVWLGYVATSGWRRGTDLLLERREAEALALTSAALNRDMKGVWTTMLAAINPIALEEDPPYDVLQLTAKAFARFPYPESFVVWKRAPQDVTFALHRSDRMPLWDADEGSPDPVPVVLSRNPPPLVALVDRLKRVAVNRPFVSLDLDIDGVAYQVIAHVFFAADPPHEPVTAFAFTVNLAWVKREYFGPLLQQVARIGGNEAALSLAVADETGQVVGRSGPGASGGDTLTRRFPLTFLDQALLPEASARRVARTSWTLQVSPAPGSAAASAQNATVRVFALIAFAAGASVIALLVTVRGVQANARAAAMKSEFVAAVTHDLKTPVALIRLVGDTLARGRYTSSETVEEYARLLSQEAGRLTRSIDSLLTYSRYTDWSSAHLQRTPVDLAEIVEDALEEFRPVLMTRGFELTIDMPRSLPRISADQRALIQVVQGIIDNAIKYSHDCRELRITGGGTRAMATVTFSDRGAGIPPEDLEHVCERFYRGRNVTDAGSGLGLAIASRIVDYHRGRIDIRSTVGAGTDVELSFPAAAE